MCGSHRIVDGRSQELDRPHKDPPSIRYTLRENIMILRQRLPYIVLLCILICPPALKAQEADPSTIWSYLGIPQGVKKAHAHLFNRLGKHPKLEAKPAILAIADPANLVPKPELGGGADAIQIAAKVKQAEDAAPQKIKAVRYLAKIGCGCYDEVGVTDALVKAMGDCTESVRLATIEAISDAAEGGECETCNENSCCNEKIVKKLAERAYEIDETGCFVELSEEVREAAADALCICCPGEGDPEILPPGEVPERERETPELANPPAPDEARVLPVPAASPAALPPGRVSSRRRYQSQPNGAGSLALPPGRVSSRRRYQSQPNGAGSLPRATTLANLPPGRDVRMAQRLPVVLEKIEGVVQRVVLEKIEGVVQRVDPTTGLIHLEFPGDRRAGADSKAEVFHKFLLGSELTGELTIVRSSPGYAVARSENVTRRGHIARGDEVTAWGVRKLDPAEGN